LEAGSWKLEVGSVKTEDRRPETEDRRPKTGDRRGKMEVSSQKTENEISNLSAIQKVFFLPLRHKDTKIH
jgi:hypothetical protein